MSSNVKEHSWGYEVVWAETDSYAGRILSFRGPGKTPMHFHKNASKSWFINDGTFKIRYIDISNGKSFEADMKEGTVFHVPCLMPVSIECLSSGSITEASNRKIDDNDYYLLTPETEQDVKTS